MLTEHSVIMDQGRKREESSLLHLDFIFWRLSMFKLDEKKYGGNFDRVFLDNAIEHILSDIIPNSEEKFAFIFSSSQQWKDC